MVLSLASMSTISASNGIEDVNDRSVFTYELLDVKVNGQKLYLKGWGLIHDNQNLYNSSTHEYAIELHSNKRIRSYPVKMLNISLTKDKFYIGKPYCKDSQTLTNACNYKYENVGFEAHINLNELDKDSTYEIYLVMKTKQTNRRYRTPLYYAQEKNIETTIPGSKVFINAAYENLSFDVFSTALRVTSTPEHSSSGNHMRMGSSCSSSHGNLLYYKYGTNFTNPLSKSMYNDLISYYKVEFKLENCFDKRRRVVEQNRGYQSYIPSTFINYKGKPLTVTLISLPRPILSAQDHTIEQYSDYDPLDYARALDKEEGDISHRIKIDSTNVNTRFPGLYQSCYSVKNKYQYTDRKCVAVKVTPVKTRKRYINKKTHPDAALKLWEINAFKRFLLTILEK